VDRDRCNDDNEDSYDKWMRILNQMGIGMICCKGDKQT